MEYNIRRPLYILLGIVGTVFAMGCFKPDLLMTIICFPEQYTYASVLAYAGAFTILIFSLEVWGMIIALPFEILLSRYMKKKKEEEEQCPLEE